MKKILWKIKYYIRRLRHMNYDLFFKEINAIHKRTGQNRIWLFFDMIYSSIRFGSGYVDYNEFEFYLLNSKEKATFLTQSHTDRAAIKFNNKDYIRYFDDKGLFSKTFKEFMGRNIIDLREASFEGFLKFLEENPVVFAKKFDEMAGQGIEYIEANEVDNVENLYDRLKQEHKYVIEEGIRQHPEMAKLSLRSVNTLRMITFLDDDMIPRLLTVALKGGTEAIIDNVGQGGLYTILSKDGKIIYPMIDRNGNRFKVHPSTHQELIGFQIPYYEEAVEMVKKAALIIPEVRFVGWDVAISEEGPLIIEGNSNSGPFQTLPTLTEEKVGARPLYEKYMGSLKK